MLAERMEELREEFADLEEPFQRYSLLLGLAAYAPQLPCLFPMRRTCSGGARPGLALCHLGSSGAQYSGHQRLHAAAGESAWC